MSVYPIAVYAQALVWIYFYSIFLGDISCFRKVRSILLYYIIIFKRNLSQWTNNILFIVFIHAAEFFANKDIEWEIEKAKVQNSLLAEGKRLVSIEVFKYTEKHAFTKTSEFDIKTLRDYIDTGRH